MSTPPPSKRQKSSLSGVNEPISTSTEASVPIPEIFPSANHTADPTLSPPSSRKRRASRSPKFDVLPPAISQSLPVASRTDSSTAVPVPALLNDESGKKRGRTNTPWTATEEQRLKQMRDAGHSWSEIAKAFPARTEGSVKKHWYKDMHYAEFAEDETVALRDAIREYEANKWKAIGQKLNKPAKACEQYAREHFRENFKNL